MKPDLLCTPSVRVPHTLLSKTRARCTRDNDYSNFANYTQYARDYNITIYISEYNFFKHSKFKRPESVRRNNGTVF